jgi:ketosteroid isomerase-like protein
MVWERAMRCMEDLDVDGYADCFAENGEQSFPFAPATMPSRLRGRERIRQQLLGYRERARRNGRRTTAIVPTHMHETSDSLVVEFEMHGLEDGRAFVVPYVHVVRVEDGKITSLRDYFDSLALASRIETLH